MANAGQCASALRLQGSSRAVATPMESVNSVLKTLSPAPRHTQVGYELEICPDCAMGTYGFGSCCARPVWPCGSHGIHVSGSHVPCARLFGERRWRLHGFRINLVGLSRDFHLLLLQLCQGFAHIRDLTAQGYELMVLPHTARRSHDNFML